MTSSPKPAVTAGGRTLTYEQLRAAAGALAGELRGIDRAAVWAETTLEAIVAMVALLEAGIELVPLNPKLGSSELEHIVSDSRPQAVIVPSGAQSQGPLAGVCHVEVDIDASGELPPAPDDPERVALVIYTSGTTGMPKGVLLPRRADRRQPRRARRRLGVDRR